MTCKYVQMISNQKYPPPPSNMSLVHAGRAFLIYCDSLKLAFKICTNCWARYILLVLVFSCKQNFVACFSCITYKHKYKNIISTNTRDSLWITSDDVQYEVSGLSTWKVLWNWSRAWTMWLNEWVLVITENGWNSRLKSKGSLYKQLLDQFGSDI